MEEFKTSVTTAPHKKVTFELTYEELLKRRLGKYELQIHARPMQPVKDFKVCSSCWCLYTVNLGEIQCCDNSFNGQSFVILYFFSSWQVDVYIHEKSGISFIDIKGGLSTKALANAITRTHVDKQVQHELTPHTKTQSSSYSDPY